MESLLQGQRTILRPANRGFSLEEQRRRFRWSKDDDLQYWSGNIPSARTFAEFQRTLPDRDWPSNGRRRSYGILTLSGELIGMVSCYAIDWKDRSAELGVYIGERQLWDQGLGTDAIQTLLTHFFTDVGIERIVLHTYESNVRAIRSYEKVGFRSLGSRRRFRPGTGYYQEVKMVLESDSFPLDGSRLFPDRNNLEILANSG